MVCGPSPKVAPGVSGLVGMIGPAQLSVAVGGVQITTASQVVALTGTEKSAGHPASTGAVLSVTVTITDQLLWRPLQSLAVLGLLCGPTPNVVPEVLGLVGVIDPAQLSVAVGGVALTAPFSRVRCSSALRGQNHFIGVGIVLGRTARSLLASCSAMSTICSTHSRGSSPTKCMPGRCACDLRGSPDRPGVVRALAPTEERSTRKHRLPRWTRTPPGSHAASSAAFRCQRRW